MGTIKKSTFFLTILASYIYSFEVKEFKECEWENFKELRLRAVSEYPMAFGTSYEEELQVAEHDWKRRLGFNMLCAKDNGKILGMIGAIVENYSKKKHIGKIISFYVAPEGRYKGIGNALMRAIIEKLKRNTSIKKIVLEVTTEQKEAIALYKKHGFHITGILENAYQINDKVYDQYIMTLFLDDQHKNSE
jgi:ribosomal protein S18 acetylase RimI-like enzyme